MPRRLIDEAPEERAAPARDAVRIPVDPVNEQALLAAAILSPELRVKLVRRLRADAFLVKEHIEAWTAIEELTRRKLDWSSATIRQLSGGKVDPAYLEQIVAGRAEPPANVDHHVAALEWDGVRARAVKGPIAGLLAALRDPTTAPERVRAIASGVSAAFSSIGSTLIREADAILAETRQERALRRQRALYPFGIDGLDRYEDGRWRMVPGAAPGKVTAVTGVPGSGKSTVTLRIVREQARLGRRVLFGPWEMGNATSLELLGTLGLELSRYQLSVAEHDDAVEAALQGEEAEIVRGVTFLENPKRRRVTGSHVARGESSANERAIDALHAAIVDSGAEIAVFDLWKRCLTRLDPEDEESALIHMQDVAKETKCHCILVQQQRAKDVEGRPDKRPTREGIKGSGAWIEVPDNILGVHRPALWKRVDDVVLEIDVLKQRYGRWPIAVEFDWDAERGSIEGGRSIDYDSPGDAISEGGFIGPPVGGGRRGGKRG